MITYVVIPWDVQSFNPTISHFPELHTLEEVANTLTGPADTIVALENGLERHLSGAEEAEVERLLLRRDSPKA